MATSPTSSPGSTGFAGSSSYAADLQSAIERAVNFANLPVQILQNKQNEITNQQAALSSLTAKFQSLSTALSAVDKANTTGSLVVSTTDTSTLSATVSPGAKAGRYTVNVIGLGSQTNAISADDQPKVSDPAAATIGSGDGYTLTVDGRDFTLSGSTSNLNGLADAINRSGAGITATVINIGGTGSPDYRLSILSKTYAPTAVQLGDSAGTSLLNTLSSGSPVTYQVNGQPSTPIESDSRTLSFASGLTVTAFQVGSADVTVTSSSVALGNSLAALATGYNNALDELSKSRGKNNGPLSGESIVNTLAQSIRSLTASSAGSGSIQSLTDLGLGYDKDGHLNFDAGVLASAMDTSASDVAAFLGSSTSGFIKSAQSVISGISDGVNGVIAQTTNSNANQLANLGTKISGLKDRIALMQASLTAKMSKADALISSLQNQNTYFTNLFAQMRANQLNGQ